MRVKLNTHTQCDCERVFVMQRLKRLVAGGFLLSSLSIGAFAAAVAPQAMQQVPLIVPQLLNVAEHKKCYEPDEQSCATLQIQFEATGLPWLDSALLERLDMQYEPGQQLSDSVEQKLLGIEQQAADWLVESYAEIKEARDSAQSYALAYDYQDSLRFIAQRHHLASFKQFFYTYTGGAHGMYSTRYLLFDLNARQQLLLPDLLQRFAESKLLEQLRALYLENYGEYAEHWLSDNLAEQAEILLTDNFVFNEQGLTFSYPPYVLGPYAEGEVRLSLAYHQLADIIKPEYLLIN